jgi:hypothetical protein
MTHFIRACATMVACVVTTVGLLMATSPAALASSLTAHPSSSPPADNCKGWGGVLNNFDSAAIGGLNPPLLGEVSLGTPYVDGNVVRADSSVSFYSWGSCSAQVAFQMQTKVCGAFGCNWVTRNHGKYEFFWAHDDTGQVSQQVTMSCRKGTNSYRVHMAVVGPQSAAEAGENNGPGIIGVEPGENVNEDGPVVKLTC